MIDSELLCLINRRPISRLVAVGSDDLGGSAGMLLPAGTDVGYARRASR